MEANIGHLPTKFGHNQMQGWKVINRYRILQVNFHIWPHLTFDQLMWPLTPEYHGGQYRASTNQVCYKQMQGWKVINRYGVLQVNLHIWPHLTFDLLMWRLTPEYHGGQYRASIPTKFGYKQMQGWKVINRYRVLQVNLHIWLHLTFDLLMWPLTPEYHGGQHRASINQVWLQTDAGLESYQPL